MREEEFRQRKKSLKAQKKQISAIADVINRGVKNMEWLIPTHRNFSGHFALFNGIMGFVQFFDWEFFSFQRF